MGDGLPNPGQNHSFYFSEIGRRFINCDLRQSIKLIGTNNIPIHHVSGTILGTIKVFTHRRNALQWAPVLSLMRRLRYTEKKRTQGHILVTDNRLLTHVLWNCILSSVQLSSIFVIFLPKLFWELAKHLYSRYIIKALHMSI